MLFVQPQKLNAIKATH